MKYTFLGLVFFSALLQYSCNEEKQKGENVTNKTTPEKVMVERLPIPEDSVLQAMCEMNLKGLTHEDMVWAMTPLDTTSPYMEKAHYSIKGAFMVYEMEFKLHDFQVLTKSDTLCTARVQHDSRNHNERNYIPQRSTQIYTYRPRFGQWRITKMEVLGSEQIQW